MKLDLEKLQKCCRERRKVVLYGKARAEAKRLIEEFKNSSGVSAWEWVERRSIAERALLCLFLQVDSEDLARTLSLCAHRDW